MTLVYHIVSFPILCGNEYCSSYCSSPLLWFCVNTVCLCLFVPLPKHYFWHGFSEFVSNTATISYSIKNFKKMISTCNIWWHGNYSMKLQYEITVWNYYCFDRHRIYNNFVLVQISRTQSEAFITIQYPQRYYVMLYFGNKEL